MNKDAVQNERGPRSSTLRRQSQMRDFQGVANDNPVSMAMQEYIQMEDQIRAEQYRRSYNSATLAHQQHQAHMPQLPGLILDLSMHNAPPVAPHAAPVPVRGPLQLLPPPPAPARVPQMYPLACQTFVPPPPPLLNHQMMPHHYLSHQILHNAGMLPQAALQLAQQHYMRMQYPQHVIPIHAYRPVAVPPPGVQVPRIHNPHNIENMINNNNNPTNVNNNLIRPIATNALVANTNTQSLYPIQPPTPTSSPNQGTTSRTVDDLNEPLAKVMFDIVELVRQECIGWTIQDQQILLRDSWRKLFYLNVSEAQLLNEYSILKSAFDAQKPSLDAEQRANIDREVHVNEDILRRLSSLQINCQEFQALRMMALFKMTGEGDSAALIVSGNRAGNVAGPRNVRSPSTSPPASSTSSSPSSSTASTAEMGAEGVSIMSSTLELPLANQARQRYETAERNLFTICCRNRCAEDGAQRLRQLTDSLALVRNVSSYTIKAFYFRSELGSRTPLLGTLYDMLVYPSGGSLVFQYRMNSIN